MRATKIIPEIFSRVSGYYRPVQQWNKGKQEVDYTKINDGVQVMLKGHCA